MLYIPKSFIQIQKCFISINYSTCYNTTYLACLILFDLISWLFNLLLHLIIKIKNRVVYFRLDYIFLSFSTSWRVKSVCVYNMISMRDIVNIIKSLEIWIMFQFFFFKKKTSQLCHIRWERNESADILLNFFTYLFELSDFWIIILCAQSLIFILN